MSQQATSPTASTSSRRPSAQQKPQPTPDGDEQLPTKFPLSQPKPPPVLPKKIPGRSSKPIINWFQRKLAGTVRHNRRVPDGGSTMHTRSDGGVAKPQPRVGPTGARAPTRVASSPFPQPSLLTPPRNRKSEVSTGAARRKTISLNGDDDGQTRSIHTDDEDDMDGSSFTRQSTWSPASNFEADEDASIRPLPPSGPPSPSPSLSASSYLSDPHTFRSMAASTKPTTLLSIDLTPNGMAHIAQVPTTPPSQISRFQSHVRTSSVGTSGGVIGSGASITFSALPPSLQSSSRPSSLNNVRSGSLNSGIHQNTLNTNAQMSVQAPLHTAHHPRNNPRPSSPPEDNASMLTLASSAFAIPGTRMGIAAPGWISGSTSVVAGDSMSHFGGSIIGDGEGDISSQYVDDDRLDVEGERDVDASLRALRPRSSRRGSWDSQASDWSAQVGSNGGMSTGTPSRSLWTTNTGGDGTTRRSEDGSVDNSDEQSLEHQTPLQAVDPLPGSDEDTQQPSEKAWPPNGVDAIPTKDGNLDQSHEADSAAVPIPAQCELKAVGDGNGYSESQASHSPVQ